MEIEKHLRSEIDAQIGYLGEMEAPTDEYKAKVDCVTKLLDRAIEMEKLAREHEDRVAAQEAEREMKEKQAEAELEFKREQMNAENSLKIKQMEEERKDRWVKNGISVAGILLPIAVTVWGTKKSFEFEKEGTITTIMGRGFLNKLLPRK